MFVLGYLYSEQKKLPRGIENRYEESEIKGISCRRITRLEWFVKFWAFFFFFSSLLNPGHPSAQRFAA